MSSAPDDIPFGELIESGLFTFYVGKERTRFTVHSKVVTATSEPFERLINGNTKEARERSTELQDVDPDTFWRFLKHTYRRDYTVPPYRVPPSSRTERRSSVSQNMGSNNEQPSELDEQEYSIDEAESNAVMLKNSSPQTNVLVVHARLYNFATMRLIYPLRDLAFQKLLKTLSDSQADDYHEQCTIDVVDLARYAYDNGAARGEDGSVDQLRKSLLMYIAYKSSTIGRHRDFQLLLEEGGELVGDFWNIVSRCLC